MNKQIKKWDGLFGKVVFGAIILGILAVAALWRENVFGNFPYGYDEGIHIVLAQILSAGYEPYKEAFVSYPALFAWSMQWPYQLTGKIEAIQLLMTAYSLLAVIGVAYLSYVYAGPIAGIFSAAVVAFIPAYFVPSITVMGEIPSIGLATLAIAGMEYYRRHGGWLPVLLSAIILSASMSMKVLPIYAPVLLGIVILEKNWVKSPLPGSKWLIIHFNYKNLVRDILLSALGLSVFILFPLAFYDLTAFWHQVVGMRLASRNVGNETELAIPVGVIIKDFLSGNISLVALAILAFFARWPDLKQNRFLLAWLVLTWLTLYAHIPLRPKHMPILIPVLAVWASLAIPYLGQVIKQIYRNGLSLKLASVTGAFLLVGLLVWADSTTVAALNQGQGVEADHYSGRNNAIWRVQLMTSPRDCVVSDDPRIVYQTERLTAPELVEVSITRIATGYLTKANLTAIIEKRNCQAVIIATERLREMVPGIQDWLAENYLLAFEERWQDTYAIKKNTTQEPILMLNRTFDNGLFLKGIDLSGKKSADATKGYISFYWQIKDKPARIPMVFVHFRDKAGNVAFQIDRAIFDNTVPPENLPFNSTVKDTVWFDLPVEAEKNPYDVYIGLYDLQTQERTILADDNSGENAIIIPDFAVKP